LTTPESVTPDAFTRNAEVNWSRGNFVSELEKRFADRLRHSNCPSRKTSPNAADSHVEEIIRATPDGH
jgi:hypothetical protein